MIVLGSLKVPAAADPEQDSVFVTGSTFQSQFYKSQ